MCMYIYISKGRKNEVCINSLPFYAYNREGFGCLLMKVIEMKTMKTTYDLYKT